MNQGDETVAPVPVYLALGSNLGDRMANLQHALALLAESCGRLTLSPIFETPPWGYTGQPAFLNLVARGCTRLAPLDLLHRLKAVEQQVGRTPTHRWGPREIDVDLLSYGDAVIRLADLEVPHPRLHERGFVLVPLAALDPDWRHPILGRTATELLAALPEREVAGIARWEPRP